MIKFIKCMNKSNAAPEVEIQRMSGDIYAEVGSIYTLYCGYLGVDDNDPDHEGIHYYCLENAPTSDYDKYVKCVRITPDMVFSAKYDGSYPTVGTRVSLSMPNSLCGYSKISETGNGKRDCVIVSTSAFFDEDKTVWFIIDRLPNAQELNQGE